MKSQSIDEMQTMSRPRSIARLAAHRGRPTRHRSHAAGRRASFAPCEGRRLRSLRREGVAVASAAHLPPDTIRAPAIETRRRHLDIRDAGLLNKPFDLLL